MKKRVKELYLDFSIGGYIFSIQERHIASILQTNRITNKTCTPNGINSYTLYKGKTLPIINEFKILGITALCKKHGSVILILKNTDENLAGLYMDDLIGLSTYNDKEAENVHPLYIPVKTCCLKAIIHEKNGSCKYLLDINSIMNATNPLKPVSSMYLDQITA
ncbi:MAG: chemotaxis protein CheW [Bacteroidales bacterium]|nr:chemotaxis protein CheW [Bacteroidales bacterium]